ncbi:class I SAM-dependent methyltransferase [Deinococcus cavernae]|uniref:class I SAM-dependent methyltransferase n=1 Tax=Deinococcus cavernae TaxID=2320857 RepID=UPI0018F62737|nr:class I SAM-dependent methyltransferase [Deinococcus cavernae]
MPERNLPPFDLPHLDLPHLDLHYVDPRLVAQYDTDNGERDDLAYYAALAADLNARQIIDLGCGTGVLARRLADAGHQVWGIEPAPEMLAYAQKQPGAGRVVWLNADAGGLGDWQADLAVMTGNVAQVFLEDDAWLATLRHLHAALRPGGWVAFESRNPLAREWEEWTPEKTREVTPTAYGPLETWLEVLDVSGGRVHMRGRNIFQTTGEHLDVHSTLRFRTFDEITASLGQAGFRVQDVYGDWQRTPFTPPRRLMAFVAQRV